MGLNCRQRRHRPTLNSDDMRTMAIKWIAAAILLAAFALLATGCVTLGYDFINQRATVTFDAKTVKPPTK